jgi:DNA-binding NarL/FixJ family response regulator
MRPTMNAATTTVPEDRESAQHRGRSDDPARRSNRLNVLIVDDNDISRCGLRLIVSTQSWVNVCEVAADLSGAINCIGLFSPDVMLCASAMKDARRTCRTLRRAAPQSVLLLITSANQVTAQTLNSFAAYDHISTNSPARQILSKIRLASLGIRVSSETPPALLSNRQQEVLELLAAGDTNSEIGRQLYLSAHTVKQHSCAIYRKLQVRNRAEAIRRAQSLGLLT